MLGAGSQGSYLGQPRLDENTASAHFSRSPSWRSGKAAQYVEFVGLRFPPKRCRGKDEKLLAIALSRLEKEGDVDGRGAAARVSGARNFLGRLARISLLGTGKLRPSRSLVRPPAVRTALSGKRALRHAVRSGLAAGGRWIRTIGPSRGRVATPGLPRDGMRPGYQPATADAGPAGRGATHEER